MGRRNTILSQLEAEERASRHHGYRLVSLYEGMKNGRKADFYCPVHWETHHANIKNVFSGYRLQCCHKDHMRALLSAKMSGAGNHFYGRSHTILSREKISTTKKNSPNQFRGVPRPQHVTDAIRRAITGVKRSEATRQKLREHMDRRHQNFDYCARKAACGKTAGKQGIFYIVKIGDELKFGSATTTMQYRLARLRQKHGAGVEVRMYCLVDDAGAYEAAMMGAFREHWIRGEYFRDFTGSMDVARAA